MSKNKVFIMYNEAIGFLRASHYLKHVINKNITELITCAPAYTVNQVFSCELLLKALCEINGINYIKNHKLVELVSLLPQSVNREIECEYNLLCAKRNESCDNTVELRKMNECLESYDNAFVNWRYYYENCNQGLCLPWIDFEIFIDILKRMVEKHLNLFELSK